MIADIYMPQIKILIQGYAKKENNALFATPTTVLIKDSGLNILVDPGANKGLLLTALKKQRLKPEDIDIVFVTHHHLDHILNIRLFPDKDIYDGATINRDDRMMQYSGKIPKTTITVIPTPGHTPEHWCKKDAITQPPVMTSTYLLLIHLTAAIM